MLALRSPISRSLLIHTLVIVAIIWFHQSSYRLSSDAPIEVTFTDSPENKESESSTNEQRIVQRSDGEEAEKAREKSYLSDKTRIVKEERSALQTGESGMTGVRAVKKQSQPAAPVTLGDLGVKITTQPKEKFEKEQKWATPQMGEGLRGGQYVQGLKEGETSALNTKEFVFFSYFDRVRRQLDQAWQPILRGQIQRIYQAGRHLASNSDYITRTLVTLSNRGEIVRVQVLEESGTFDLDQAAVEALKQAGPYPNPPSGLVNGAGQVQIRWDFVLKT